MLLFKINYNLGCIFCLLMNNAFFFLSRPRILLIYILNIGMYALAAGIFNPRPCFNTVTCCIIEVRNNVEFTQAFWQLYWHVIHLRQIQLHLTLRLFAQLQLLDTEKNIIRTPPPLPLKKKLIAHTKVYFKLKFLNKGFWPCRHTNNNFFCFIWGNC